MMPVTVIAEKREMDLIEAKAVRIWLRKDGDKWAVRMDVFIEKGHPSFSYLIAVCDNEDEAWQIAKETLNKIKEGKAIELR